MVEMRCLGGTALRSDTADGLPPTTSLGPKRLALLAYVAVAGAERPISRDKLLALFWPESDTERARGTLRSTLHLLRRDLGAGLLVKGGQTIAIDPSFFSCDVLEFRRRIDDGEAEAALELYRGDFLDGFFLSGAPDFERWVEQERQDLRRVAVEAAWTLARRAAATGSQAEAGYWARCAFGLGSLDEGALRRLLHLLDEIGDRGGALQAYEEFAARLAEEFEARPAPETQELVAAIRGRLAAREPASKGDVETQLTRVAGYEGTSKDEARHLADHRRAGWRRLAWVGVGVAGLTAWLGARSASTDVPTPPSFPPPSVVETLGVDAPVRATLAVLPFDDLSDDPQHGYIARGLTTDIRTEVSKVAALRVLGVGAPGPVTYPPASTFAALADSVGADVLLAGSVRLRDQRMRITVELVSGISEDVLWARTFDEPVEHVFDLQDRVAISVAEALEVEMSEREIAHIARPPTSSQVAYFDYLRAWDLYLQLGGGMRLDRQDTVLAILERALEEDPSFAAARGFRGYILGRSVTSGGRLAPAWYDSALVEVDRALASGPEDPTALLMWAATGIRPRDAVYQVVRKSMQISPGLAPAAGLSWMYETDGRLDEAIALEHWSLRNHTSGHLRAIMLGRLYQKLGLEREAEFWWTRYREATGLSDPGNRAFLMLASDRPGIAKATIEPHAGESPIYTAVLADAELFLGNYEAAKALLERVVHSEPVAGAYVTAHTSQRSARVALAFALDRLGALEESRAIASEAWAARSKWIEDGSAWPTVWYDRAALRLLEHDRAAAYRELSTAVERGWVASDLARHDPLMSDLHAEERFESLMRDVDAKVDSMADIVRARDRAVGRYEGS